MYKLQFIIIALLLPFSVASAETDTSGWVRVKDNVVFESPSTVTPAGYAINLQLRFKESMLIELVVRNTREPDSTCELLDYANLADIWDINGRRVAYNGTCVNGIIRLTPKYPSEIKYVIDEFLTKMIVHVGPTTISTVGFIEAYGEVIRYASYRH